MPPPTCQVTTYSRESNLAKEYVESIDVEHIFSCRWNNAKKYSLYRNLTGYEPNPSKFTMKTPVQSSTNLADDLDAVAEGGSSKGAPDSSVKGSTATKPKSAIEALDAMGLIILHRKSLSASSNAHLLKAIQIFALWSTTSSYPN